MNEPSPWLQTSHFGRRLTVFLGGGIIYSLVEVVYRGFTHWSMTLTGGICLLIMYLRYISHPNDSIVMNLGSSCAGYGYEYLSSTLDRVKAA